MFQFMKVVRSLCVMPIIVQILGKLKIMYFCVVIVKERDIQHMNVLTLKKDIHQTREIG